MLTKNIVWLASYPKSGNTWVRVLIANALRKSRHKVDINYLRVGKLAAHRSFVENQSPLPSSELSIEQQRFYRRLGYFAHSKNSDNYEFLKVHDKYGCVRKETPLFPSEVSALVLYIVRNPLDVAISLSFHLGCTIDESIDYVNNGLVFASPKKGFSTQLYQNVGSWKDHAMSWLDQSEIEVMLLRYEDLHTSPHRLLQNIFQKLNLDIGTKKITTAVEESEFSKLKGIEKKTGFYESPPAAASFFRVGKIDQWQTQLNRTQIESLRRKNGDLMRRLCYE